MRDVIRSRNYMFVCLIVMLLAGLVAANKAASQVQMGPMTMITDIERGAIVQFGGRNWIMLDPVERKLLLQTPTDMSFWNTDYQYNYDWGTASSTYKSLHGDGLLATLSPQEQSWIQTSEWNVRPQNETEDEAPLYSSGGVDNMYGGPEGVITAQVGLLTYREYLYYTNLNVDLNISMNWYLLTPYVHNNNNYVQYVDDQPRHPAQTDTGVGVRYAVGNGSIAYQSSSSLQSVHQMYLRPAIHLIDALVVTGGAGTTNSPYIISESQFRFNLSTYEPTNENVTVTIVFPDNAEDMMYRIESDEGYQPYSEPFEVSENTTVYAKYFADGWIEAQFVITNIDKVAPTVEGVEDGAVYTLSVTPYSSDMDITAVVLLKDGTPISYTLGNVISDNGSYELTVTDEAGNATEVWFTINIDSGAKPQIVSASTDGWGDWIIIQFDQPLDSAVQLDKITVSGDAEAMVVYAYVYYYFPDQLWVEVIMDTVDSDQLIRISLDADAVTSQDGLGNAAIADYAVANIIVPRGDDNSISITDILPIVEAQTDINFDGVFDREDIWILLNMIEPVYSSNYYYGE